MILNTQLQEEVHLIQLQIYLFNIISTENMKRFLCFGLIVLYLNNVSLGQILPPRIKFDL
jgi:hypothetical protein